MGSLNFIRGLLCKEALNDAIMTTNIWGKICLAAFPNKPVEINIPHMVINNIYIFGIRGEGKSATHIATQFMKEKRFDDAIKIVIKQWS